MNNLEQILGLNHPDTATSFNDLAELYTVQGHYAEVVVGKFIDLVRTPA